jgi:glutamate synthase (NADPH/NADH) small chain
VPKRPPEARRHDFEEVATGLDRDHALAEADRCLECKNAPCVRGCPVEIDIPGFIRLLKEGDILGAAALIKEKNNLPAICGRVCPQETQCEVVCALARKWDPVAIGALERFVADWEAAHPPAPSDPPVFAPEAPRVAVAGSGPAGLTAAADLARLGYRVTVFESLHAPGGVLRYGIPEFRLPRAVLDREIDYVRRLGVEIETNVLIGKTITIPELFEEGFEAVFIGAGAGLPYFLGIPGENSSGVYSANEFLSRINLMRANLFPRYDTPVVVGKRVVVIGGGNVAMDSARSARRLGAAVTVVYRRSRVEMPARREEVDNAEEEGVAFQFLTAPIRVLSDDQGWVSGLECQRMELGEPDASGRRRPVPIPGSEFVVPTDTVVVAVSQGPNPLIGRATPELRRRPDQRFEVDPATGATSIPGVFAGGDIANEAGTVIAAMGDGKRAARAIHAYITEKRKGQPTPPPRE